MNPNQVSYLRKVVDNRSERALVLAVTSGKGGVGKTNISANLSICLAVAGKRVVLFDADLGLGNLDVIMNLNSRHNLSHVLSGRKSLDEIIQFGPAGVEIICGGSGIQELVNIGTFQRQRLIDELDEIQRRCDFIIMDTGAGINSNVINFCLAADHTLVVTTPEPTAMTDAYAMIKVLSNNNYTGKIGLLVNMACNFTEGRKIYRQISDVATRFLDIPIYDAGVICRDDMLISAVKKREPVVLAYPHSNITENFAAISARLGFSNRLNNIEKESFFRKVVNWLF